MRTVSAGTPCNPPELVEQLFRDNRPIASYVLTRKLNTSAGRYLLFVCGGVDGALQEAEIALWRACRTWKAAISKFSTYACCIIYRQFAELLRDHLRKPAELNSDDSLGKTDVPDKRCGRDQINLEDREWVESLLDRLNEESSTLLREYYLEGNTLKELGRIHGVTNETIRHRLVNVRKAARKMLAVDASDCIG